MVPTIKSFISVIGFFFTIFLKIPRSIFEMIWENNVNFESIRSFFFFFLLYNLKDTLSYFLIPSYFLFRTLDTVGFSFASELAHEWKVNFIFSKQERNQNNKPVSCYNFDKMFGYMNNFQVGSLVCAHNHLGRLTSWSEFGTFLKNFLSS